MTKEDWDDKIRRRSKQVKAGFESKYRLSGKDKDLTEAQNEQINSKKPLPVFQRQRTNQSGAPVAPPDLLTEIKEHHQSEETESAKGTILSSTPQSIAETMAAEFE